jgi:hypothetical protein
LEITDTRSNQSRQINSVLDDKQYSGYFPVQPYEKISILNTWMCRGRQGDFKALCPNPKAEPTEPSSKSSSDDI